jgi:hypothetical protein
VSASTCRTAVLSVVAALVGGLAASAAGPRHVSLAVAVAVSLVIGTGTAAIAARREVVAARVAGRMAIELDEELDGKHSLASDSHQGAIDEVRVLPGRGEVTWWEAARQELPPAAAVVHAPPPELASYLETAQVAQCPNCGELTLDAAHVTGGWALNCPACSHGWTWRPGTPWPDVIVIPGRLPSAGQPSASGKSGNSRGPAVDPQEQWR